MLKKIDKVLAPLTWLIAGFAIFVLVVGPEVIGAKLEKPAAAVATPAPEPGAAPTATEPGAAPTATEPGPAPTAAEPDTSAGKAVFASAGCDGCHTLADAGASGGVGPNLDDAKPDAATVVTVVTEGRGTMPAFGGDLSSGEIDAVAAYVSSTAGG
jgi:mono/diheme cytochrome c family protein